MVARQNHLASPKEHLQRLLERCWRGFFFYVNQMPVVSHGRTARAHRGIVTRRTHIAVIQTRSEIGATLAVAEAAASFSFAVSSAPCERSPDITASEVHGDFRKARLGQSTECRTWCDRCDVPCNGRR